MKKLLLKGICTLMVFVMAAVIPLATYADPDLPCDGTDPYSTCPLDTGTFIMVVIAFAGGAFFIYKQQKRNRKTA